MLVFGKQGAVLLEVKTPQMNAGMQPPASEAATQRMKKLLHDLLAHTPRLLPGSVGVITLHRFTNAETFAYARKIVEDNAFWSTVREEGRSIREQLRTLAVPR